MALSNKGSLFRNVVNRAMVALSADELATQELKAFDAPEDLVSAALDQELQELTNPAKHGKYVIDLKPYIDRSAFSVPQTFSLSTTYSLFRSMGLRHLVVVDATSKVVGIITRHNLLEHKLHALLTVRNIKTPDEILAHHVKGSGEEL
jgi:CBS domain-containing protein